MMLHINFKVAQHLIDCMLRPGALREAVLKDVHQYLGSLEQSRSCVEACEDIGCREFV